MFVRFLVLPGLLLLFFVCDQKKEISIHSTLSDPKATSMATALFNNLQEISGDHILVGHQDALAYGLGWKGESFRTDINDVLGDHPALFGWDLGHMGDPENIDGVPFEDMRKWAIAVYEKGGLNTYSWHMRNYATGGSSLDRDSCVEACLPGGRVHEVYLERLDQAAEFFSGLTNQEGELIPVVFRPFHEMTGSWFWWGRGNCSAEQYKTLFRFTMDYLRNEKGLHQLIVAYSSDRFETAEQYMDFYPGDNYVDVMAFDDYHGLSAKERPPSTIHMLEILDSLSSAHRKIMAISETGLETIPNEKWFTGVVLPTLDANESTRKAAWILFWRNGRPDHFYAPYPGHPAAPDFIELRERIPRSSAAG
ncbi:MAG: glycosyl hydrolase [Bacteroidales bacterium]|nr:glycosyl hydrolase [Bacteroidales bacterium]